MMKKTPIISSTNSIFDIAYALAHVPCPRVRPALESRLAVYCAAGRLHTLNSGLACFFLILEALKALSSKKDVVLPAYTAGSLIVAIKKAGLRPVLCDISLRDFNAGIDQVRQAVGENTLAVVSVHMFGIPVCGIETLKENLPASVFLIEDCCQAMGSRIKDDPAGAFGDVSFFSFNRGKNVSANNGGCIINRNGVLDEPLRVLMESCAQPAVFDWAGALIKSMLFMAGTNPYVYGLGNALAAGFREVAPPGDLSIEAMGNFQAALGLRAMQKAESLFMARYRNGTALLRGLAGVKGITLPYIFPGIMPVFNRLPIVVENADAVELIQNRLWRNGIETSRMYLKPLHHMFDLGYGPDDFPNAVYFAAHALTLPVHAGIGDRQIQRMVDTIRSVQ